MEKKERNIHANQNEYHVSYLNEVKVVFLGDGEVGKTHIIARLLNDGDHPIRCDECVTPGIAIHDRIYNLDGRQIKVHFWDFGGQEILHSMHRIFFAQRAIYVVVLDARHNAPEECARYWLNNIKCFAPDAPVLLVLNKNDLNPSVKVNYAALIQEHHNIKRIVSISSLKMSRESFNHDFIEVLLEQIYKNRGVVSSWPNSWIQVRAELELLGNQNCYIFKHVYTEICRKHGIIEIQDDLLHWFNDLGLIFYFDGPEDYDLKDYIVLRPNWVTNALYAILFNKSPEEKNGLIPHRIIYELLSGDETAPSIHCVSPHIRYIASEIQYIIGIMRKFQLSFSAGNNCEFIPALCDWRAKQIALEYEQDETSIEFCMEFDFLPDALIHRMMISRQHELDIDNVWRSGARFHQLALGLSAVVFIDNNVLHIFVRNQYATDRSRTYLSMLKANVDQIWKNMGLQEPANLIIYKLNGKREAFQYEALTALMEAGQSSVYSRVFRRMIPIADILREDNLQAKKRTDLLLSTIANVCMMMQQDRLYWNARDEDRCTYICTHLQAKGYLVRDQLPHNQSFAKKSGSLDLIIYKEDHQPWAACEILSVREKSGLRIWNDHLTKLLTNYNAKELSVQFLISFVECDPHEYQSLWTFYNNHMREYDPRYGKRMGEYQHVLPLPELPEYLRVARFTYDIGGNAVTVYHYFVHIGQVDSQDFLSPKDLKKRLDSAIAEITSLEEHLSREHQARLQLESAMQEAQKETENWVHYSETKISQLQDALSRKQNEADAAQLRLVELECIKAEMSNVNGQKSSEITELINQLEQQQLELQKARADAQDAMVVRQELETLYEHSKEQQLIAQDSLLHTQQENALLANQTAELNKQIQNLEQELRDIKDQKHFVEVEDSDEDAHEDSAPAKSEYRVIILGDSEAGKSQILHRLRHPDRDPKKFPGDVTPGIDIASRCFMIGDIPTRVNFWDFGGQEILYSMHRLFLAENTMYVIVLNTRNDNQDEQAKFWLHYVELYATGAPVILVLNKIDQNPKATLNMPVLERMFRFSAEIKDVLSISAREWSQEKFHQEFVEKLRYHIEAVMDESSSFTEEELKIYEQIRTQNKEHQILEMSEFKRICSKGNLPNGSDFYRLAERFHKAGMLIYFKTRTNMITNPVWITNAIYKILEQGVAYASNGIIDCEKIEDILYNDETVEYQKSQIDFVLKIMHNYGLSYQIDRLLEQEFIPVLCRRDEPDSVEKFISEFDTIQMQMIFRYLPAGILYQLMVDLNKELVKQTVWLSGAMFKDSHGCKAVVTREKDRMTIFVRGENRVLALRYMETIRKRIEGIAMGDMYRANVQETLLGYYIADRGEFEFFDYDRLSLSKEHNLNYVMSKCKPGALIVQDVLDQHDSAHIQERDKLLNLVLTGCRDLQDDQHFWNTDENTRNRELARRIQASFTAKDQTESGMSKTGNKPGQLDIKILNAQNMPIAILEALNTQSINTGKWRDHLDKLMDNYNTSGLRYLILTSYVNCAKNKFKEKFMETSDFWKNVAPKSFENCLKGVDTVVMEECPELIRITRADYVRNDFMVSLYHFLVHIGGQ